MSIGEIFILVSMPNRTRVIKFMVRRIKHNKENPLFYINRGMIRIGFFIITFLMFILVTLSLFLIIKSLWVLF